MIIQREPQEVTTWLVAFQRGTRHWWMRLLPGCYKHVFAFQFSAAVQAWVVYDVSLSHTRLILLPAGQAALEMLGDWTVGSAILRVEARDRCSAGLRLGFWCVPAVKHLLGLRSGALRPDALWRDCLRNGAQIVTHGQPIQAVDAGRGPVARAGAAAADRAPAAAAAEVAGG